MNTNRKRYEIDNSVSINNLRTSFNEVLNKLDAPGYSNLCSNNYFKTKLLHYNINKIISKWRDYSIPATDYDGVLVDNNSFKSDYTGVNANIFAIKNASIYQELNYNQVERLSSSGVLTISLFYVSSTADNTNATIKLQRYSGSAWADVNEATYLENLANNLIKQMPGVIGTEFPDYLYYRMVSKLYNVSSSYFDVDPVTNEGKLRIVITNPHATKYKILVNALAYFGSMDGASFVKNQGNESSLIRYDETKGEYYISNDGEDDISLTTGKYIITVGTRGTYATLEDALNSLTEDNNSVANDRIIFLTSSITLTQDIPASMFPYSMANPGYITILGNGNTINLNNGTTNYYLEIPSYTSIQDVIFSVGGTNDITVLKCLTSANYITFKNVRLDVTRDAIGDTPLVLFTRLNNSNIHFSEICYATAQNLDGGRLYTIKFTGGKCNVIEINNITRFGKYTTTGSTKYISTNIGYGLYLENVTNVENFQFNKIYINTANWQNASYNSNLELVHGESVNYNDIFVGHIYSSGTAPSV